MKKKMIVVERLISELIHPDYNPRYIKSEDFEQLKKSLMKFDSVEPAVINMIEERKNIIIGGNQRVRACEDMGWKTYPCVEVVLTADAEKELNIRLNKNTGNWDFSMLANEFSVEDLVSWGFTEGELLGEYEQGAGSDIDDDGLSVMEYPITIIQNMQEYQRWLQFKEHNKVKLDSDAFNLLLEMAV